MFINRLIDVARSDRFNESRGRDDGVSSVTVPCVMPRRLHHRGLLLQSRLPHPNDITLSHISPLDEQIRRINASVCSQQPINTRIYGSV